jgi:hypothetical protein
VPRRNNRDKRFDPKDSDESNQRESGYSQATKPKRKRKDKGDKNIYRESQ